MRESVWTDATRLESKSVKMIERTKDPLTKASRVDLVRKRNNGRQRQEEEQKVSKQEITAPERELDNLDNVLASRLGHGVVTEPAAVPLTRPPRAVGLIVLELARDENRDQDLLNRALDRDDRDQTEHRVG